MLERQLMLLKTTALILLIILKILAKKPIFLIFLPTISGIASVSHPSLIILRAPKHEAKFFSKYFIFLNAIFIYSFNIWSKKINKIFFYIKKI